MAYLCRGKKRQRALDAASHGLGQIETCLIVREILLLARAQRTQKSSL